MSDLERVAGGGVYRLFVIVADSYRQAEEWRAVNHVAERRAAVIADPTDERRLDRLRGLDCDQVAIALLAEPYARLPWLAWTLRYLIGRGARVLPDGWSNCGLQCHEVGSETPGTFGGVPGDSCPVTQAGRKGS